MVRGDPRWLASPSTHRVPATDRAGPSADFVAEAIDILTEQGPALGRPLVDRLKGSLYQNMKELRPGSSGRSEVRMIFAFDPAREAIFLVAGDKSGR
ncbi:type II toxin-antitoxin system RelE/ParE family toxin [Dactylosporangium sp. NPDC049525]